MPRFDWTLLLLCLLACHAEPAQVLFGLDARAAGSGSRGGSPADAGADAASADAPLQAWIDVSNLTPACGQCSDISARVSGGVPPYTITWSDPTLVGPGPHRACPSMLTGYLLVVMDSRSTVASAPAAVLRCSAPTPTVPRETAVTGMATEATCFGRLASEFGQTCSANSIGLEMERSIALAGPMVPGVTYSALLGLSGLQASLANGMSFRLFGGRSGCAPEQLLGIFEFSANVNAYGACFVPDQAYDHVVAVTDAGVISLTVLDSMAICGGACSAVGK